MESDLRIMEIQVWSIKGEDNKKWNCILGGGGQGLQQGCRDADFLYIDLI